MKQIQALMGTGTGGRSGMDSYSIGSGTGIIGGIWKDPSLAGAGANGDFSSGDPFGWIASREAQGAKNVEEQVGKASVDVMSAYDKARMADQRIMGARGINPSSGIFQGKTAEWALQRAAAEAGARNRARTAAQDDQQNLMDRLLSMKISQYNTNRNTALAQANSGPVITVGGKNPSRDAKNQRNAYDQYIQAVKEERDSGGSNVSGTGNPADQAINTNSPGNGTYNQATGQVYTKNANGTGQWGNIQNGQVVNGQTYNSNSGNFYTASTARPPATQAISTGTNYGTDLYGNVVKDKNGNPFNIR